LDVKPLLTHSPGSKRRLNNEEKKSSIRLLAYTSLVAETKAHITLASVSARVVDTLTIATQRRVQQTFVDIWDINNNQFIFYINPIHTAALHTHEPVGSRHVSDK